MKKEKSNGMNTELSRKDMVIFPKISLDFLFVFPKKQSEKGFVLNCAYFNKTEGNWMSWHDKKWRKRNENLNIYREI